MGEEAKKELPPPSAARAFINMLPLLILTWYLCNYGPSKNPKYLLKTCGQNLHTIGVAIEKDRLISEDKLYNQKLEDIFSKTSLPECPVGGKEAYLNGYTVASDRGSYLLVCKGDHHKAAEVPPDFPRIAFSVQESMGAEQNLGQESKEEREEKEEKPEEQEAKESQGEVQASESPRPQNTPESE